MVEMTMGGGHPELHPCCHPERREGSQCNGDEASGERSEEKRDLSRWSR
jgi:hypothetical protein